MKLQRLLSALISTDNEAADDLLLEALRIGNEAEQAMALETLVRRGTSYGLSGVLAQYDTLPASIHRLIAERVKADLEGRCKFRAPWHRNLAGEWRIGAARGTCGPRRGNVNGTGPSPRSTHRFRPRQTAIRT